MKPQKAYSTSGIILFLLSLIYLGAELVFNRQLLDVSSSVRSDPDQVEHIQYFGRAASGLGFTLLVLGIFQPSGFRIIKRKHWTIFAIIALICMMPFALTLAQTVYERVAGINAGGDVPYTTGMYWGLLPFAGLFFVGMGRGYKPVAVIFGLILMAWPAMFYGQRLAVERFIISPTTAEDRLNAHYILMLRSGIEDCTITVDGTQFCDSKATKDLVEERSTRAVLGAMFMLNTGSVFDGLTFSREQIISSISAQDMWFSSKEYYQRYLQQISDKREQYEEYLNDTYYLPYKQASDLYQQTYAKAAKLYADASHSAQLDTIAEDAATQVAGFVELGWEEYQRAASAYKSLSDSADSVSNNQSGLYDRFCRGRESLCNNVLAKIDIDGAMSKAKANAEKQFYAKTGYLPDISTKDAFIRNEKTQDEIRGQVEQKLQERIEGYQLPAEWLYDPDTFKSYILRILQDKAHGAALEIGQRAQQAWHDKVQAQFKAKISPGLNRDDFFKVLGGDPLPPLKDLALSEDAFHEKYIVPMNRKIIDQELDDMKKEGPSFANRQEQAEKGKDYIRVLYIPAIALCLSIMIVVITIGRYLTRAATDASKKIRWVRGFSRRQLNIIRPFYWTVFIALAVLLPYQWPNPYIATKAYQKSYHFAREKAPVTAVLLDWVVHMQPIIYRAGVVMPDIAYIKDSPRQE